MTATRSQTRTRPGSIRPGRARRGRPGGLPWWRPSSLGAWLWVVLMVLTQAVRPVILPMPAMAQGWMPQTWTLDSATPPSATLHSVAGHHAASGGVMPCHGVTGTTAMRHAAGAALPHPGDHPAPCGGDCRDHCPLCQMMQGVAYAPPPRAPLGGALPALALLGAPVRMAHGDGVRLAHTQPGPLQPRAPPTWA